MISGTTSIVTVPDSRVYPQIVTVPASSTLDKDVPEEKEYQYRSMTPGEDDISRIYEDEIYHTPDMNELTQDTRCYIILGLERLLFVDSSSHIWSS